MNDQPKPLFHLLDTPVTGEPSVLVAPLSIFGLGFWLAGPTQPWPKRLRLGGLMLLAYVLADLVHYIGHILSSRYAGAPIDRIHMAAPLPRAVYLDHEVSPQTHRLRSLGGPLASALGCLLSWGLRMLAAPHSTWAEWLKLSGWLNGLTAIGSLFPLPFIDGGVILKWTLVERGRSADAADQVVRQANLLVGGITVIGGIVLLLRRWRAS